MKMKLIVLLFLNLCIFQYAWTQQNTLNVLLEKENSSYKIREENKKIYLKENPSLSEFFTNDKGITYYLYDVVKGIPVYEKTFNLDVAKSTGVNYLRNNVTLGYTVNGQNIRVGIWDAGLVRSSHIEFQGRVNSQDGASEIHHHPTHVTGTILAAGLNNSALGMAPSANSINFDFNNDASEILGKITSDQSTLLVSNHSYGTVAGWDRTTSGNWVWYGDSNISTSEDYKFGFYDSRTKSFDEMTFLSPYYTIVKSAGNDRNDTGDGSKVSDGPYDCIPTWGNAKNIITVGSVKKLLNGYINPQSVEISSFSSWGPTDDGRIKPDIMGVGENVVSTLESDDSAYGSLSGTSMSAPNVTGAIVLLQDLNKKITGNFLKSASVKGLIIHTANDVSTTGPDYKSGWGLLNAKSGTDFLLNNEVDKSHFLLEDTLIENQVLNYTIFPKKDSKVKVTIVWTDPPATPLLPSLDPTDLMLINDLDIKVFDGLNKIHLPWVLDPGNPAKSATKGDNFRDNVEQVVFTNSIQKPVKIELTHKGILKFGQQPFSILVSYEPAEKDKSILYWIGGSGNWSDTQHWSSESGGVSANRTPSVNDVVIFDQNSAISTLDLNIDTDINVSSFYWYTKLPSSITKSSGTKLSVLNNLVFETESINTNYLNFEFTDTGNKEKKFVSLPNTLKSNLGISVLSSGDLILDSLSNFSRLELIGSNSLMTIPSLFLDTLMIDSQSKADMQNATIEITKLFKFLGDKDSILTNNNNFTFSTGPTVFVDSLEINGYVLFKNGGDVSGFLKMEQTRILGTLIIRDSAYSNHIVVEGNSEIIIGKAFSVGDTVEFLSTDIAPVSLTGNQGIIGYFDLLKRNKFCFDNLIIDGINVRSDGVVNAGINSAITNSTGWIQENCTDVLFANFEFNTPCTNGVMNLKNISEGSYTDYLWMIDGSSFLAENPSII
ncbi:MAG: S8 family serine peptidase, partial [Cyclobacteriaceae bacterium]|nr:S8 family serine peptidase [Cyclobacteriaceae bacterium]